MANGFLYDPGKGGTIFKINKSTGAVIKRINPFGTTIDPNTFTASPLSVDANGNIYYNVIQITQNTDTGFLLDDVVNSWLVKVTPTDAVSKVSYSTLFAQAVDQRRCSTAQRMAAATYHLPVLSCPGRRSPMPIPQTTPCGSQRAALNIAPAIAPNGTIYTVQQGPSCDPLQLSGGGESEHYRQMGGVIPWTSA